MPQRMDEDMKIHAITVLMPVYNGEKYLKEAIESILGQTFEDFEFLIIDDGSTDTSQKIILSYSDKRIRLVKHQSNQGLISRLNEGLGLAKGKYLARMDCDDIALPERLAIQYRFMEKHDNVAVCGSWAKSIGKDGKYIAKMKQLSGRLLKYCFWKPSPIIHPTAMLRMSEIGSMRFSKDAIHAEDYDFWLKIGKRLQLFNLRQVLLLYRIHGDSVSQTKRQTQLESSYKSFIRNIAPNSKISREEYLSLSSLDFSLGFFERAKVYRKLHKFFKIPVLIVFLDNCSYIVKRLFYGKK